MEQETQKSNPAPESPDTPVASNTKVTQQTDAEPPCSTTQRAIWDDAQQLATLRDRANQSGEPLAKVLFQASLQTLADQQQAAAFRERVTQALIPNLDQRNYLWIYLQERMILLNYQ